MRYYVFIINVNFTLDESYHSSIHITYIDQLMSFKNRLSTVQKELFNINANIKTYKRQVQTLRQTKQSFEKAFQAKNTDIRRSLTTELERIHEQLKRHIAHHKNENARIKQQLDQLNLEKEHFQTFLRNIRDKLEEIERQVGQ